jgi:hypothetical protein
MCPAIVLAEFMDLGPKRSRTTLRLPESFRMDSMYWLHIPNG